MQNMKNVEKVIIIASLLLLNTSYSQIITEILINYPYEKEVCQYIEIFNNTQTPINLRDFSLLVQGYEIKITNIFLSDFETEGITNSFILEPNQFAIVLPYSYAYSSKPFYFPSNTLILTTSTKYLGKTTPLNLDIIQTIKLLSNKVVVDSVSLIFPSTTFISFERYGNNFLPSQIPSFGFTNNPFKIYFSKPLCKPNEKITIFLEVHTNTSSIEIELVGKGTLTLTRTTSNTFESSFQISKNGERIIARFNNLPATTRALDLFQLSESYNTLLLNEINFLPTKSWLNYFFGGSQDEKIIETDKYVEIVNLSKNVIPTTNLYLHCISKQRELMFNLKELIAFSSRRGLIENPLEILPEEYLIIFTPNITSNMAFILRDNHPYKGGQILHFVEETTLGIIPFNHSNKFVFKGYPTVSLLPNAFPSKLGGKFLNWIETPARYNGFRDPSIVVDSKYKRINSDLEIYVIDEILEPTKTIRVFSKESKIVRTLEITNQGFWYYGKYKISTNPLDKIYAKELDEITIEYSRDFQNFSETVFVLPQNLVEIPPTQPPFLEKSIIKPKETIKIINVKKGDNITFFTKEGNYIKTFKADKNDKYEIDSSFLGKKGIFIIQLTRGDHNYLLKIVLTD